MANLIRESRPLRARTRWGCATAALLIASLAPAALADTSFLMPNVFRISDKAVVTAQASFTEDFPRARVAVQSSAWMIVKPDGSKTTFRRIEAFEQLTILEAELGDQGTYRLSTGERLGRLGQQILVGDKWTPLEPGATPPAGAQTRASQTVTIADVYISRGKGTRTVVDTPASRLELRPITHPNEASIDAPFKLRVLLDGKPVTNQDVHIQREGGAYKTPRYDRVVKTDAKGEVSLTLDRAGPYLLMTRMSADAPAGAQTPIRSYTTSLTIEVD